MKSASLNASIHRLLIVRLGVATIILSLLFAAIAYFNNQSRLEDEVVELTRLRTNQFNLYIRDLLDSPEPLAPEVLQRRLQNFVAESGKAVIRDGHFVLVRIYDETDKLLLENSEDDFAAIDAVRQAVDESPLIPLGPDDVQVVTASLKGLPFVGVDLPMKNSAHKMRARILGVFAVSPDALANIRGNILQTMLYVVGLIIATALAIYPIITNLLSRLSRTTIKLLDSNLEILQVLGGAIAKRDSDTDEHNYRVSVYAVCLAEALKLPRAQIRSLIKGALLHDVGKLGIRDNILLKPGKLDEEEFAVMKTHVEHGLEITARASWLQDAQPVVGGHHEKFDGAGYPAGLSGKDIPLAARIFAITDVFDALTSKRPYKEPMSFTESMQILESSRGSHFDPELIDAFCEIAQDLYDTYSGKDDKLPKDRLELMTAEYFKGQVIDLLA